MLSRRGVSSDLETSPYVYERLYDEIDEGTYTKVEYVFSSKINMDKFDKRFIGKRVDLTYSLSNRFKMFVRLDILSDIMLYSKIEHRGFLIKVNDEVITCLKNIALDGKIKILRNYEE